MEPFTIYQTEQQLAAIIQTEADSLPGPKLTIHEVPGREYLVVLTDQLRGRPYRAYLASTRTPGEHRVFKTLEAALGAAKRIAKLANPDHTTVRVDLLASIEAT